VGGVERFNFWAVSCLGLCFCGVFGSQRGFVWGGLGGGVGVPL